jgi:hypothetical protein
MKSTEENALKLSFTYLHLAACYIFFFSVSLKILQLQKRLQQQFVIRRAFEKTCYLPFSQDTTVENSIPQVYPLKHLHGTRIFFSSCF